MKILVLVFIFVNLVSAAPLFDFFSSEEKRDFSSRDIDGNQDSVELQFLEKKRAKSNIELIPYVSFSHSTFDAFNKDLIDLSFGGGVTLNTAINYIFSSNLGYMLHTNFGRYSFDRDKDLSGSSYGVTGNIINLIPMIFYEIKLNKAYLYLGFGKGISHLDLSGEIPNNGINIDKSYDSELIKIELFYEKFVFELSKIDTEVDDYAKINQLNFKLGYIIRF